MKKKLLYYGDSPTASTGFGNVARHVLKRVADRYDITVFGFNELSLGNPFPFTIIPAMPNNTSDPYGKEKFCKYVLNNIFDVWFLQNDIHFWNFLPELVYLVRSKGQNPHIFTYTVIDGDIRREHAQLLSISDCAGIPSQFGIKEILKHDPCLKYKLAHIPHGIDPSEFFPLTLEERNEFRKKEMSCDEKDFLIVNVNRNSIRKDITRTLLYYAHLKQLCPNAKLYLHMEENEEGYRGYDLKRVITSNRQFMKEVSLPNGFRVNPGMPLELLNKIYNAADLVVSTTLGEGFGLSSIEAMAAKTLVMMPNNSALIEIIADGRGIPISCGTTLSEWTIMQHDMGFPRPLTNIEDMLAKTISVIKEYPKEIVEKGYNWVTTELPWDKVVEKFVAGFEFSTERNAIEGRIDS